MLTSSLALAFVSLCAAGLYAKNLSTLQETIVVLARERTLMFRGALEDAQGTLTARLAALHPAARLNGTSLDVELRSMMGLTDAAAKQDHLEFRNGKVTSRQLSAQGFSPSRYTLARQDDGTLVWETVQTDKTGAMMHWRGEWDGQIMQGVLTKEVRGKPAMNFSFVGATQPQRKQPTSET